MEEPTELKIDTGIGELAFEATLARRSIHCGVISCAMLTATAAGMNFLPWLHPTGKKYLVFSTLDAEEEAFSIQRQPGKANQLNSFFVVNRMHELQNYSRGLELRRIFCRVPNHNSAQDVTTKT